MPQIRKILFPVDFSGSCLGAARYVEAFAGKFDAEIMLLHAVANGERVLAEEVLPGRKKELDAFLADELKYYTTHRVCEIEDDPAAAIVDEANEWGADLVMLPTRGLGFFRRRLLGSVTAKALHDLNCPIWTSVHADAAPPLENIHCRRILYATALDPCSRSVLQWADWLAGQYGAKLGIAHATVAIDSSIAGWSLGEEFSRHVTEQAEKRIFELQTQAGTKVSDVFIGPGNPEDVVAEAAAEFNADLLVIGRHSGSGIAGNLFQNAYAILREAPCPVISL